MVGAKFPLVDRERSLVEGFRLNVPALSAEEGGQVVQIGCGLWVFLPYQTPVYRQRLSIQLLGFGVESLLLQVGRRTGK